MVTSLTMVVGCYYSKVKYIFDFTAISEGSLGPKSYPQLPAMQSKKAKRLWVTLSTKSTKCIKIRSFISSLWETTLRSETFTKNCWALKILGMLRSLKASTNGWIPSFPQSKILHLRRFFDKKKSKRCYNVTLSWESYDQLFTLIYSSIAQSVERRTVNP